MATDPAQTQVYVSMGIDDPRYATTQADVQTLADLGAITRLDSYAGASSIAASDPAAAWSWLLTGS